MQGRSVQPWTATCVSLWVLAAAGLPTRWAPRRAGLPPAMDPSDRWEIGPTADFVVSGGFRVVVLQFPDELLAHAAEVSALLRERLRPLVEGLQVYILADTAYNALSVDEVVASHVNADCMVHYGAASLSSTSRLPCFFVFPQQDTAIHSCSHILAEHLMQWAGGTSNAVVLFSDQGLTCSLKEVAALLRHQELTTLPIVCGEAASRRRDPKSLEPDVAVAADTAEERTVQSLEGHGCEVQLTWADKRQEGGSNDKEIVARCDTGSTGAVPGHHCIAGIKWHLPEGVKMEECLCIWLGPEDSPILFELSLHHSLSKWVLVDIENGTYKEALPANVAALLKRRYYLIEKTRNANIVGILVSTLSTAGYLKTVQRVKRCAHAAGKKTYLVVIGKPTTAKLANFPEVDVFVMICDPPAMILDSKEFLAPLVTPYEAQVAFCGMEATLGVYRYAMSDAEGGMEQSETGGDKSPRFSLVDGSVHVRSKPDGAAPSNAVAIRGPTSLAKATDAESAAGCFFSKRTFQGLDASADGLGTDIVRGRSGRAAEYQDEGTLDEG
eukprot:evm.model.scf_161.10 EVM.evm.TU.scf_161.10   scf_161:97149-102873(-)